MPQEFHVLRCCTCQTFQVQQIKKVKKWSCKMCGHKQSVVKVYGQGTGADCRAHVQKLNMLRGQVEENSNARLAEREPVSAGFSDNGTVAHVMSSNSKWEQYLDPEDEADQPPGGWNENRECHKRKFTTEPEQFTTSRTEFEHSRKAAKKASRERYKQRHQPYAVPGATGEERNPKWMEPKLNEISTGHTVTGKRHGTEVTHPSISSLSFHSPRSNLQQTDPSCSRMDSHYSGESPQKEDVYLRELSTKNKMAPKHTASIVSKGESGKETVTGSSKWAQFLEDKISSEDEEDEDSNLEEASVLDPAQEHKSSVWDQVPLGMGHATATSEPNNKNVTKPSRHLTAVSTVRPAAAEKEIPDVAENLTRGHNDHGRNGSHRQTSPPVFANCIEDDDLDDILADI